MRIVFLLLMAMLAVKTTSAQGQEACSNAYASCTERCVSRPSESLQNTCIESCQSQTNACYAKIYGNPGGTGAVVASDPRPPEEAEASEAPKRPARKPVRTAKPKAKAE